MKDNEDRNKKILVVFLILLAVGILVYDKLLKKDPEEDIDTTTISVVTDRNRFYTVTSCVNKFLTYLTSKNTDSLYLLLDENYKNEKQITKDNIYNFIGTYNNELIFSPKKIFEQRLSRNVYKYYIKGYISADVMDSVGAKQDYYIIVIQDQENLTFSIMPYDGEMFK